MIAQRILRSARPALRSATVAGSVPRSVAARRTYASGPTEGFKPGSDTPWIVASVLGFGGLFFYVTSPGSKKGGHGHGHGHDDGHASEKEESHDEPEEAPEPPKEPKELPDGSIEHPEGFIEVKRPEIRDDAPEGDKVSSTSFLPRQRENLTIFLLLDSPVPAREEDS